MIKILKESETEHVEKIKMGDVVIAKITRGKAHPYHWGIIRGSVNNEGKVRFLYHDQFFTKVHLNNIVKIVPDVIMGWIEEYRMNELVWPHLEINTKSNNGMCEGVLLWKQKAWRFKINESDVNEELFAPTYKYGLDVGKFLDMLKGITTDMKSVD